MGETPKVERRFVRGIEVRHRDEDVPARTQHAEDLGRRSLHVRDVLEHFCGQDGVEGSVRKGQAVGKRHHIHAGRRCCVKRNHVAHVRFVPSSERLIPASVVQQATLQESSVGSQPLADRGSRHQRQRGRLIGIRDAVAQARGPPPRANALCVRSDHLARDRRMGHRFTRQERPGPSSPRSGQGVRLDRATGRQATRDPLQSTNDAPKRAFLVCSSVVSSRIRFVRMRSETIPSMTLRNARIRRTAPTIRDWRCPPPSPVATSTA